MGKQYRVMEIAESLIRLYGLEPHRDIAITITGLRPGEKMYEELSYEGTLSPTANHKIFTLAHDGTPQCSAAIETFLSEMDHIFTKTPLEIRRMLQLLVPEYRIEDEEIARHSDRLVT
jgi:FlaA1/EpsC-like NDP-sugar epimerase